MSSPRCFDAEDIINKSIEVSGGEKSNIKPVPYSSGTTIQITDLFFTTPTRLKFLKSEGSETSASIELVNKLALSREKISFKLISQFMKKGIC